MIGLNVKTAINHPQTATIKAVAYRKRISNMFLFLMVGGPRPECPRVLY